MAREMNAHFAPKLAELGQYGPSPDGITFAGTLPGIALEMPEFKNAALGLADVTSAFQLISRKALWEVLCALEDSRIKVRLWTKEVPGSLLRHQLSEPLLKRQPKKN